MPTYLDAGPRSKIRPGRPRIIRHRGERVVVFNVDGEFYAINNRCPHNGGPLSEGSLDGTLITCPWHGWTFDLRHNADAPRDGVIRYKVVVEGEQVKVELAD